MEHRDKKAKRFAAALMMSMALGMTACGAGDAAVDAPAASPTAVPEVTPAAARVKEITKLKRTSLSDFTLCRAELLHTAKLLHTTMKKCQRGVFTNPII